MANQQTWAFTGSISIAGAVSMLTGAALWGASGTDLWQALANDQMEEYMSLLPGAKQLLVMNTSFWVLGVLLMATAISLMADFITSSRGFAQMAKVFSRIGASIAIVSFIMMLSLSIVNPPLEVATIIGWVGTRIDDIATMLIIGFSPLCLSNAGKSDWVPGWLSVWGYLAGICALLGIISLFTGITALGFIIIPIGIGWMIAAGVVLIKKRTTVAV